MTEVTAVPVSQILGWKISDDGKHILLGLQQPVGEEFALAITPESLFGIITSLVDATAAITRNRGQSIQQKLVVQPSWYELGRPKDDADQLVLTFYTQGNGYLSFQFPDAMGKRLLETLAVSLGEGSNSPPPGIRMN